MSRRGLVLTRIAGFNHHDGATKVLSIMPVGTRLRLEPDAHNAYDPNAVKVISPAGRMLGFVPRECSGQVSRWLVDRDVYVQAEKEGAFNGMTIEVLRGDPLEKE